MSEPFVPELKKPGDMIRSGDWNRLMSQVKDLGETKLDRAGPDTYHGALTVGGDLEVDGRLAIAGASITAGRAFGGWREVELDKEQTATTDGLVAVTAQAGLDASGTLVGETPVGQPRLSVSVPVAPAVSLVSDRAPRLLPEAGAPGDYFGSSVALQGDVAVVGAPLKDANNLADSGCVFVYVRKDGKWERQARLVANDAAPNDRFGTSVAISGNTILVGAPGKGSVATKTDGGKTASVYPEVGAAYVFVRKGDAWVQQAVLRMVLAEESSWNMGHFGLSVALSGDTAVIGGPEELGSYGAVGVCTRKGETWGTPFWIAPYHAANQRKGAAVAISGDTVLLGAPRWFGGPKNDYGGYGYAFAFIRKGDAWAPQADIIPADRGPERNFGIALALDGDNALIGEPGSDSDHWPQGDAYFFVRKGGAWMEKARLVPRDSTPYDRFGASVAISGKYALIGAPGMTWIGTPGTQRRGDRPGAVYLFEQQGDKWVERTKWVAGDLVTDDGFGTAVALDGSTSLFGSIQGRNEAAVRTGTTYVSSTVPPPRACGFTMPVRSGDTWVARLASDSGTCAGKAYWLPVESSGK